jgi:hypothetical protein
MSTRPKKKTKSKTKQYRAPCLCGCQSRCPATIAAHGKVVARGANKNALAIARSTFRLTDSKTSGLVPAIHPPRRRQERSAQTNEGYTTEGPMEVDLPQASQSGEPSPPLAHIWADRTSRHEREDEDLVSEPGSPEPSGDEDKTWSDRDLGPDEPKFLSDDEGPDAHMEISATEQLTGDFQLRSTRAGTSPHVFFCRGPP